MKQKVQSLLKELQIQPKRSLGQNFLINPQSQYQFLKRAHELQPQWIVEIGPGLGALTSELQKMVPPERLLLIEKDRHLAQYWREKQQEILEADALKVPWPEVWSRYGGNSQETSLLVGNLPYPIASRLVVEMCLQKKTSQYMLLSFQKEVAQRITARKGQSSYGLLSIFVQSFWEVESVMILSPRDFYPSPKVHSEVLLFRQRSQPQIKIGERHSFLQWLKKAFKQTRKMLTNNLPHCQTHLEKMKLNPKVRAHELSMEQFYELYRLYISGGGAYASISRA